MYVPMDKEAIKTQFELTKAQIRDIQKIAKREHANVSTRMWNILRKKGIVTENHDVLTEAGRRIAERLDLHKWRFVK